MNVRVLLLRVAHSACKPAHVGPTRRGPSMMSNPHNLPDSAKWHIHGPKNYLVLKYIPSAAFGA